MDVEAVDTRGIFSGASADLEVILWRYPKKYFTGDSRTISRCGNRQNGRHVLWRRNGRVPVSGNAWPGYERRIFLTPRAWPGLVRSFLNI